MQDIFSGEKWGRYARIPSRCLNDVHKASGGAGKHRPSKWLDDAPAKALVAEVEALKGASKVLYVRRGYGVTGTYAVKELVYAYAARIKINSAAKPRRHWAAALS